MLLIGWPCVACGGPFHRVDDIRRQRRYPFQRSRHVRDGLREQVIAFLNCDTDPSLEVFLDATESI